MTTRERSNRLEIKRFRYRRCSSWERCRSTASTFRVIASETAGRQSALITTLTRGARAATASTARCTTAITSAQLSPSIKVNIASVLFGSPDSRTTRTAVRSLLGLLHLEGLIATPLAAAVPSAAVAGLGLPQGLDPDSAARLVAHCDRRTAAGRRDHAMITLMLRLGLRRGEVASLKLDDIDWRAGELTVCGKGNRIERMPLPTDVGAAIAAYLHDGRPPTAESRSVFVRFRAPHQPLSTSGVSSVVTHAAGRAGLGCVRARKLRHTAATEMVRAGATLPEVGQVLRHRRLSSTGIYAKVDIESLRELARPWPIGGQP